ncbi:hypothetical protein [Streptomyces niger]|nr:hypothetical protein [Streptomyces niger]
MSAAMKLLVQALRVRPKPLRSAAATAAALAHANQLVSTNVDN